MRFLAVAAHPDDIEFNAGGTLVQLVRRGWAGSFLVCTDGSKGTKTPEQAIALKERRRQEQQAAAELLGVTDVHFLDFVDGELTSDLTLRKAIVEVIRRVRPTVVLSWDPMSRWIGDYGLNHPDHVAAGEATSYAVYPSARDNLMFPDLYATGLEGFNTQELWLWASNTPNLMVDVRAEFDKKVESLGAHGSQTDPRQVRQRLARMRTHLVRDYDNPLTREHAAHPEFLEAFRRVPLEPIGDLTQWLRAVWSQLPD